MAKKEQVYYDEQGRQVVVKKDSKVKWILLGCGIPLLLLIVLMVLLTACTGSVVNEMDKDIKKTEKKQNEVADKKLKVGDSITVDDVVVKVVSVENVQPKADDLAPERGKALKVNFEFENKGKDQVLVQDGDFQMSADGDNQEQWFGGSDTNVGFSHQLNNGRKGNGYMYFDVKDAKQYAVEMNFMPHLNTYKAKWEFTNADIK